MEDKELEELYRILKHLREYNQRLGQIFEFTFEQLRRDGINPFLIEDDELLEAIERRYKGVMDEHTKAD